MTLRALVHEGAPLAPHDAWTAWSAEPFVLLGLAASAVLYARGRRRLPTRSPGALAARRWQAAAFWSGWLLLAVALLSPLHAMGAALLWAHMAQHELLMVAAAPLLVLGRPLVVSLRGLGSGARRRVGRWIRRLAPLSRFLARLEIAWALHAAAVLAWHVPALYDRTVESALVHSLQHASFIGTALLYWWSVLTEARRRARHGAAVLSLFTTAMYTGGLGALLTVSSTPWYSAYGAAAPLWGLTRLEDQQLAGLIMWVPAAVSYLAATLWLVASWLGASERLAVRREQLRRAAAALPLLPLLLVPQGACEVGPALSHAEAEAGVLTNTPDNLSRWIQSPREVDSLTAMPDVGVTPRDARDIAAYLYIRR